MGLIDRPLVLECDLFLIPVLLISLVLGLYSIPKTAGTKDTSLDLLSVLGIVLMFSGFLLFLNQVGTLASLLPLLSVSLVLACFINAQRPEPFDSFGCFEKPQLQFVSVWLSCLSVPFTGHFLCLAELCPTRLGKRCLYCRISYASWGGDRGDPCADLWSVAG